MKDHGFISVKNWEKHQHYKDRNPPWIKLYGELLDDYEFSCLQDASKLHLILIWLLASRYQNHIPADPAWLKGKMVIKSEPNLSDLVSHGFIMIEQNASNMLATCKQSARPETETETETEREEETHNARARKAAPSGAVCVFDQSIGFDQFWATYPSCQRKKEKAQAEAKYKTQIKNQATHDAMLARLEEDKASWDWQKENGAYIPLPKVWLNKRRWVDEIGSRLSSHAEVADRAATVKESRPVAIPEPSSQAVARASLWGEVMERLAVTIDPEEFGRWFGQVECRAMGEEGIWLTVPNELSRTRVLFYDRAVMDAAGEVLGCTVFEGWVEVR